jgi:inner membrane protein
MPRPVNGLVLTVPYYTYDKVFEGNTDSYKMVQSTAYAHFLPDQLLVEGEVFPEERYRGIYQVIVYRGEVELWGTFSSAWF